MTTAVIVALSMLLAFLLGAAWAHNRTEEEWLVRSAHLARENRQLRRSLVGSLMAGRTIGRA